MSLLTRRAAALAWHRQLAPAVAALRSSSAADSGDLHSSPVLLPHSRLHVLATARRRSPPLLAGVRTHFTAADDGDERRESSAFHDDHELGLAGEYLETLHHAAESASGWQAALDIFAEIRDADGAGLSVNVATALIEVLGARRRVSECIDVLRYAREQGVRPRIHAYSSAIACCYHEQKFVQALKVFEVMRNDGYVPKSVTYSRALSAALKSTQHELVLEIFDDMLRNKVDTSIVIYNNILNSCARVGDGHSAVGVLRAIKQRRLEMTQSTYHSLAICAGKTGLSDLALEVLESMQRDGFEPTITIYNSAISALAKGKRWKAVVALYDDMSDDLRAQLQGLYLGGVLMAYAKSSQPELKQRAIEMFTARREQSEKLNLFAHNAVLTALLESGQFERVHEFAKDMKRDGVQWDTVTYQCVVFAYIRSGDVNTALHMLHSHAKKMQKSTECYRELIQHFAEERQNPREACRITMQMMQNNSRLSRLDWHNALTHSLQLPDRALYWNFRKWMKIRAAGIVDDVPEHLLLPEETQKQRKPQQSEPQHKATQHRKQHQKHKPQRQGDSEAQQH